MLLYLLHVFYIFTVAAQESPGIVIARPGQDVELLCTLGIPSTTQHTVAWIIDHIFYGVQSLINGILPGYSVDVNNNNLFVQNIVMNDSRNDTEYRCVIVMSNTTTILNSSDPTFLYVAGKYIFRNCVCSYVCMYIATCLIIMYIYTYIRTYIALINVITI